MGESHALGTVTEEEIRALLDLFYGRVREDPRLGPVFERAVGASDADWERHLVRLSDFWSSVMLRSGRYQGDPFSVHLRLPDLEPDMFDRWLALFGERLARTRSRRTWPRPLSSAPTALRAACGWACSSGTRLERFHLGWNRSRTLFHAATRRGRHRCAIPPRAKPL